MAIEQSGNERVGRRKYWAMFFANIVAVIVLAFISLAALAGGEWMVAILCFVLIIPIGIYFRVIMMRRCRDIGWPPSLPWITFGLGVVASMWNFGNIGAGLATDPASALGGVGFSWLVSIADFVLMITLGSIKGRSEMNYQDVFGGDAPVRTAPAADYASQDRAAGLSALASEDVASGDAMDDAIARAVENYRRTGSAVPGQAPVGASPRRAASTPPTRQTGFGRKMV